MPLPTDPLLDFADAMATAIATAYAALEIGATASVPSVTWPWALTCQRAYVPAKKAEELTGLYVYVIPPRRPRERNGRVWKFEPELSLCVQKRLSPAATLTGDARAAALKLETDQLMAFATSLENWIGSADRVAYKTPDEITHDVAYLPKDLDERELFVRVIRAKFFDGVTAR